MGERTVIGVDIGGTKLIAGAVDERLEVRHRAQRAAPARSQHAALDALAEAVAEVRAATHEPVAAVGFGIPSLIDQTRGVPVTSVNLELAGVPFAAIMSERIGLPVFVDNDANSGAARRAPLRRRPRHPHAAMLTIGTGIGGGLIFDGEVYRGAIGAAAELGHMVIDQNGPPCQGNCPNHGCLESLASGTALGARGAAGRRHTPDSALGRGARRRAARSPACSITELALAGDGRPRSVLRADRLPPRRRDRQPREHASSPRWS